MLPYIEVGDVQIGPFAIHPFGLLVATGVIVGIVLAEWRARRLGLDVVQLRSFTTWMLVGGFVGGHVLDEILYHPQELVRPWSLLLLWRGLSSFGGFAGALLAALAWKHTNIEERRYRGVSIPTFVRRARPLPILAFADVVMSVFPVAWAFGRSGCSVIGPEFRSAAIGVFAQTSYQDLQRKNGAIEDRIEKALRERLRGKHLEISGVLIQKVTYAPEIMQSEKERVVSQEQTLRNKQLLENEAEQKRRELTLSAETKKLELENHAAQKKMELEAQTEQTRMELKAEAEQKKLTATTDVEVKTIEIKKDTDEERFRIDSALRNKEAERKLTTEQARIDKMKADADAVTLVAKARGEATARLELAKATAEEKRAEAANITPMEVQMHAYDALGLLGGTGTTILLGDWSKLPGWLFPHVPGFTSAFSPLYALPPALGAPPAIGTDTTLSRNGAPPSR